MYSMTILYLIMIGMAVCSTVALIFVSDASAFRQVNRHARRINVSELFEERKGELFLKVSELAKVSQKKYQ
jgi:hypothetical protein